MQKGQSRHNWGVLGMTGIDIWVDERERILKGFYCMVLKLKKKKQQQRFHPA